MPYIPEHQAVAPQQIQQPETFEASRLQSAAGYCQDLGRNALRGIVTSRAMRSALALGLAVGTGTAVGVATEMTEQPREAYAATFVNDYPNMDAQEHDKTNYEWWVDEDGDGVKQIKAARP